jgi:4-azaleucine resistance transporter AzlC
MTMIKETFTFSGAIRGARQGIPMAIGVIPFGMVFGIMARQAGLGFEGSALMSATVFAGAAQFVAVGLWREPLPIFTIAFTAFLVNLRYLLMGAALHPFFRNMSRWKSYGSALVLSDGGWAMQLQEFNEGRLDRAFLLGNGIAQYFAWIGSTVLGFTLGAAISDPRKWGLTFIVPASFLALLVGMWRGRSDLLPWLIAAASAVLASKYLGGNWYILIGSLVGSFTGALLNREDAIDAD